MPMQKRDQLSDLFEELSRQDLLDLHTHYESVVKDMPDLCFQYLNFYTGLPGCQAIQESCPSRPRQEILLYSEKEKGGIGVREQERKDQWTSKRSRKPKKPWWS